jgi:hypothetical protein
MDIRRGVEAILGKFAALSMGRLSLRFGLRCQAPICVRGSSRCRAERILESDCIPMRAEESPGAKSRMVLPECYPKLSEVIP